MPNEISYDKYIFAANLKRLMRRENENQSDIARLLGVSKAAVSGYCSGTQMARMDRIEQLAHHFGVSRAELIENADAASVLSGGALPRFTSPIEQLYNSLNDAGREELMCYGRYLGTRAEYRPEKPRVEYIKHFLVPAAAGYASPVQGEDYELAVRGEDVPAGADFSISIRGDSMEPYIRDGQTVYVRRGAELAEFDVGVFFVDGDVYCKQWCRDYTGALCLLSANPMREDANIIIPRSAGRNCVCFGKVLLPHRLPRPSYR